MSVETIGIGEALTALDEFIAKVQIDCEVAVNEAVEQTFNRSQELVPYDSKTAHAPGYVHLKDSASKEVDGLSGSVTYGTDHSEYVEQGTSRMAAQPYLNPAFEGAKGPFLQKCQEAGQS